MSPEELNVFLKSLKRAPSAEASADEKQIYSVKIAIVALIDFVTSSLEEIGIDALHEITNPSLDDLDRELARLYVIADGELKLQQTVLFAQVLINNIREKNPDLCSEGSRLLKSAKDGL
ncbi:hypothetical protein [Pantoea ananatis]